MTTIQNVQIRGGTWQPDGDGLLKQAALIVTAGRATRLVGDLAVALADALDWGEYGRTVVPFGMPYGTDVDRVPVGALMVRIGTESIYEYAYAEGPDTSWTVVELLLNPGSDHGFLGELYGRMVEVEEALEGMPAPPIPTPTPPPPPPEEPAPETGEGAGA